MAEETTEQLLTPCIQDNQALAPEDSILSNSRSSVLDDKTRPTRDDGLAMRHRQLSESSSASSTPDQLFEDLKGKSKSIHSADQAPLASPPTSYSGSSFMGSTRDKGKAKADPVSSRAEQAEPSSSRLLAPPPPTLVAPIPLAQSRSRSLSMPLPPAPNGPALQHPRRPRMLAFSAESSPVASGASTPASASRQSLVDLDKPDRGRFSRSMSNIGLSMLGRTRPRSSTVGSESEPASAAVKDKGWKRTKNKLSRMVKNRSRSNSSASPWYSPPVTPGTATPIDFGSRNSSFLQLNLDSKPSRSASRARAVSVPVIVTSPLVQVEGPDSATGAEPVSRPPSALSLPPRSKFPLDLFDFLLPRELRVRILGMLIECCIDDWQQEVASGQWRGLASRDRWVGELRGRKELIRAGRVSRSWLSLSLDGQLWTKYPGSLFGSDILSSPHLLRIFTASGSFVRSLDLTGMRSLNGPTLATMVDLVTENRDDLPLTKLDLTGCTGLSSPALAYLLQHCPQLQEICLRGLISVDARVLSSLFSTAQSMRKLDLTRCSRLPSQMLADLPPSLRILKISGVRGMTDELLVNIACRLTSLETFDVSGCTQITDDAFLSIVQQTCNVPCIELDHSQRRITGRDSDLATKRKLSWRHLNVSACRGLTDRAASYLAYAVPDLEILEMARIGAALQPEGIRHLLESLPGIRCVDFEDATALTDAVLLSITPTADSKSPGSQLEHLILNGCAALTDAAIRAFLERSPVTKIELDSTSVSETTAKAFVHGVRARKERGAMLSLLDGVIGRRLAKSIAVATRPRAGWRGYDSRHFDYHDENMARTLQECDESLVVLRSFHGHTLLDLADESRRQHRAELARLHRGSNPNSKRAQALRDFNSSRAEDSTSAFCVIS